MSRTRLLVVGVLLLAAIASGTTFYLTRDDDPPPRLTVTWGGSEGRPCCTYDADARTVRAALAFDGDARRYRSVTVTVAAYADENTSEPVGSASRTVQVGGTEHRSVVVSIPVSKRPHVDEDGIAACRLAVKYQEAR